MMHDGTISEITGTETRAKDGSPLDALIEFYRAFNAGDLDALAISDGGDLLWSTGIDADAALYFAASLGEPRFLLHAGRDATLAFANDGHDGVVADPQRKELLVIRDIRDRQSRILK